MWGGKEVGKVCLCAHLLATLSCKYFSIKYLADNNLQRKKLILIDYTAGLAPMQVDISIVPSLEFFRDLGFELKPVEMQQAVNLGCKNI